MMHIPALVPIIAGIVVAWYLWNWYEPRPPLTRIRSVALTLAAIALLLLSLAGYLQPLPVSPLFLVVSPVLLVGTLALPHLKEAS